MANYFAPRVRLWSVPVATLEESYSPGKSSEVMLMQFAVIFGLNYVPSMRLLRILILHFQPLAVFVRQNAFR